MNCEFCPDGYVFFLIILCYRHKVGVCLHKKKAQRVVHFDQNTWLVQICGMKKNISRAGPGGPRCLTWRIQKYMFCTCVADSTANIRLLGAFRRKVAACKCGMPKKKTIIRSQSLEGEPVL